jgi:hypothetical protein
VAPAAKGQGLTWRKSTRSIANGQCIEAAVAHGQLAVRDSVDKFGPMVTFTLNGWHAFINQIKDGNFSAM